jgi:hypothetical protein
MTELSKGTCSACEIGAPLVSHDQQIELLKISIAGLLIIQISQN